MTKVFRRYLFLILLLTGGSVLAQPLAEARQLAADRKYGNAIELYKTLYSQSPDTVYVEYYDVLMADKKYRDAEKLVEKQMTMRDEPVLLVDLGRVYFFDGRYTKATETFNKLLTRVNGDLIFTEKIVKAFVAAGLEDYAIAAYERTGMMIGASYYFNGPLARLYANCDNLDKAIDQLLITMPGLQVNEENVKSGWMELLCDEPEKVRKAQKAVLVKVNQQPKNIH